MSISILEFIAALDEIQEIASVRIKEQIILEAGKALEASMKRRIFNNGLDSQDNGIADAYSKSPRVFTQDQFAKRSAFKPNTKTRKGGKAQDAMYLQGGYEQFREIQGRRIDKVNLELSSSLQKAIQLLRDGGKIVIAITNATDAQKKRELEGRIYGKKIFSPSPKDKTAYNEALGKAIAYIIQKATR
jgi:hypothetical protein